MSPKARERILELIKRAQRGSPIAIHKRWMSNPQLRTAVADARKRGVVVKVMSWTTTR